MKQALFEARHAEEWTRIERWLVGAKPPKPSGSRALGRAQNRPAAECADPPHPQAPPLSAVDYPAAYRRLCQQLALAERRSYSLALIERLRRLVERGHLQMYRPPRARWRWILDFFAREFPQRVRALRGPMLASALLFFGPLIACFVLLQYQPEWVSLVLPADQRATMESMYDPAAAHTQLGRDSGSDVQMFGHYVLNNVSIGFRTFALGLIAGIGSVLVLVVNGVMIGTVAGHLTAIGYGDPFWRFVAGHSAPELLAIVLTGGAGLQLGLALLAPGRRTRLQAFKQAGISGARIALGAFAMLVFAAFVEAFWSSIGWLPATVKYTVGIAMWLLFIAWLLLAGRGRGAVDAH